MPACYRWSRRRVEKIKATALPAGRAVFYFCFFCFPFDQSRRLSRIGVITISTITTAMNMLPSVEPTSSSTSASAVSVPDCEVGVAVASWVCGSERLNAKLLANIAIPSKIQNAMRMVFEFILIAIGWYRNELSFRAICHLSKDKFQNVPKILMDCGIEYKVYHPAFCSPNQNSRCMLLYTTLNVSNTRILCSSIG